MNHYKITFSNGDSLTTGFNGTQKDAEQYYIGRMFNIGCIADLMVKGVKVEVI